MPDAELKEEEIEAAERLRGQGEFATALALTQEMLNRAHDDETRMRLLFNVICCSTGLGAEQITREALRELETLPEPEISRAFTDLIQVVSHIAFGRVQEALDLINVRLNSELLAREDLREWKYEYVAYKGRALTFLQRWKESSTCLDKAFEMFPDGKRTTDILIDKALCMMMFNRFEESFSLAVRVRDLEEGDMKTLAMQYMAEASLALGDIPGAMRLYADIKERLPCRLVQEERVDEGIRKGFSFLERNRPEGRPS